MGRSTRQRPVGLRRQESLISGGSVASQTMSPIGTFRTWRDVQLESVMHGKADIWLAERCLIRAPHNAANRSGAAWAMPRGPDNRQGNTCGPIMGEAARFIKFLQVSNIDQRLWNDAVTIPRSLR